MIPTQQLSVYVTVLLIYSKPKAVLEPHQSTCFNHFDA